MSTDLQFLVEQIADDQARLRILVNGDEDATVVLEARTSPSIAGLVNDRLVELEDELLPLVTEQAEIATAQAEISASEAVIAGSEADRAESARDAALLSRGLWQTTAQGIGNGVAGTDSLVAGSGGTNGTFALAFSGGTQVIAPKGYFVVAGGAVTQVVITYAGHYSAGTPTLSFAASAGLTGASATAVMGANTQVGQYFSVPVAGINDSLILYKVTTGPVATEITRYPSSSYVDDVYNNVGNAKASNVEGFSLCDGLGNTIASIDSDGVFRTKGGSVPVDAGYLTALTEAQPYVVCDGLGNVAILVDKDGGIYPEQAGQLETAPSTEGKIYDYEINQIFCYGQSLSIGGKGVPAISLTQNYDNLMFTRGMIPQYSYTSETPAQWYASLVPSVEENSPIASNLGETVITSMGNTVKDRILIEDGLAYTDQSYQILGSCPGVDGASIAAISKGTAGYNRLIEQVTYGRTRSLELDKLHGVPCVFWMQGESNSGSTVADYKTALNQIVNDLDADIRVVTGQTKPVKTISYQLCTTDTSSVAQQQLETENPLYYVSHAMYLFEYVDGLHLSAQGMAYAGAYFGLAYKRIIINGENWRPLTPTKFTTQGSVCVIDFNVPKPPLMFDTSQVVTTSDYGFQVKDALGDPVTILSVSIPNPAQVKIKISGTFGAGYKVLYGLESNRGNLRDSQGDSVTSAVNAVQKRMDNWCLLFNQEI